MNSRSPSETRIEALTFFRFVAAAIVVIFHFGRDATGFEGILIAGRQMVTFFFVLSGFVLTIAHWNRAMHIGPYLWSRVARIAPVYLVALALTLMIFSVNAIPISKSSLLLSLMFLQAWFPSHAVTLNGAGWSLSVEALFYLIFPFAILLIRKYNPSARTALGSSALLWLATQVILTAALSTPVNGGDDRLLHDLINYFPLAHLCSFFLGIAGAVWLIRTRFAIHGEAASLALVTVAALGVVVTINHSDALSTLLNLRLAMSSSFLAPLYLLFILAIAVSRSRSINFLGVFPLVILGEASYSFYILQLPVHEIYRTYVSWRLGVSPGEDFTIFFLLLLSISIMSFLWLEKPANRFIKSLLAQPRKAP